MSSGFWQSLAEATFRRSTAQMMALGAIANAYNERNNQKTNAIGHAAIGGASIGWYISIMMFENPNFAVRGAVIGYGTLYAIETGWKRFSDSRKKNHTLEK